MSDGSDGNGGNGDDSGEIPFSITHEYPLATTHLKKGDRITVDEIERAFETCRSDRDYGLKQMRASEYITRRLRDRHLNVVIVSDHDDLVILNDADAAVYTKRRFELGIRSMGSALRKQTSVDRANLTAAQVEEHDRNLVRHGAIYAATKKTQRQSHVLPGASKRQTPGLPKGDGEYKDKDNDEDDEDK